MASKAAELTIRDVVAILAHGSRKDARTGAATRRVRGTDRRAFADIQEGRCYSYGRHFPLFQYVPKSGRRPALFVLNGDTWRGGFSATSSHQEIARDAVAASGVANIVLPFSALDGARLDIASIRPIHVRDDATWHDELELRLDAPDLDDVSSADGFTEKDERPHGAYSRSYTWRRASGTYSRTLYRRAHAHDGDAVRAWHERQAADRGPYPAGRWRESDSFAAPVSEHAYFDGNTELRRGADGVWRSRHWRHRLGDSLFSAVRTRDESRMPAAGESASTAEGWHCGEHPHAGADWRREGIDAPGHVAGMDGRTCFHCGAALVPIREPVPYRARFLSSFDYQERAPLYFLCEVPRGAGSTVEHALDALAPRAVHAAIARGRDVRRQGDVFLIETALDDATVYARARTRSRLSVWVRGARPRAGEVCHVPNLRAADRRTMAAWRVKRYRELRAASVLASVEHVRPSTSPGARGRFVELRAEHAAELARARADARRFVLTGRGRDARHARERVERYSSRPATDSHGYTSARHARDGYRRTYPVALEAWRQSGADALERFRADWRAGVSRETVRDALGIYGTAHAATEVVTARGGAVYVRGEVRHVPDLERNRRGDGRPDHAPVKLGDGTTWYVAVRNRVPRANTRRRKRRLTAGLEPAGR